MRSIFRKIKKRILHSEESGQDSRQTGNPLQLEHKHIKNCRMLTNRYELLQYLPKNAEVAEVGVLAGDFSQCILDHTSPSRFTLIDTFFSDDWSSNKVKRFEANGHLSFITNRFRGEIEKKQISVMKGLSSECLPLLKDNSLDWIYIDADHTYEVVRRDLKEAARIVKPEGLIVVNDYIYFSHVEKMNYGVIQAVNELCVKEGFELIYLALHPQMYCDVVLRRL
jgi:hypothetical protein